jgi:hypothetical protein
MSYHYLKVIKPITSNKSPLKNISSSTNIFLSPDNVCMKDISIENNRPYNDNHPSASAECRVFGWPTKVP